ncbi:MAG: type II 3-dehydroquinate dehydratase [Pseudomonadota bacterium]|jgi:3-dehydroquinate dehydratase-2|nr:type II 3-dehydroquinate dehydratase [Pseudomonadota bacterium]
MSQPSILLLNGPNLNLLGTREPEVYGSTTLEDIEQSLVKRAAQSGIMLACKQSNAEHELIDAIHTARGAVGGIIFNPGAFTHTSIALRDALVGAEMPFIEVHLSNVFARERFRHHSYLSDVALSVISGLGTRGYDMALRVFQHRLLSMD